MYIQVTLFESPNCDRIGCSWSTKCFFYIPGKSALVAHYDGSEHCDVMVDSGESGNERK